MITYVRVTSVIAGALILAACAATGADTKPKTADSRAAAQDSTCLTETGSRIAADGTNCVANGHSYSSDDISRTGATSAGEALRLLDPSVTIQH